MAKRNVSTDTINLQVYLPTVGKDDAKGRVPGEYTGTVSVSFGGRFPVSLYPDQWRALAAKMSGIVAFVDANETKLPARTKSAPKPKAGAVML